MNETKKMSKNEIDSLKEKMQPYILKESQPPYTYYQIKCQECTITAYTSGKVVFQGQDLSWLKKEEKPLRQIFPQAGSDEVGTGDYFGPVVVAGCILNSENQAFLSKYPIQDSKQLSDLDTKKLANIIKENSKYSICICSSLKYNQVHEKHNMVDIKCLLHNQVYINLMHKGYSLPDFIVIDQFTPEKSYYRYLKDEKEVIQGIHFETKAENKYLSVACASILARNAFLEVWEQMEKKYQFSFHKGAGPQVDQCARNFVKQFGRDELKNVCKLHFKNTQKI